MKIAAVKRSKNKILWERLHGEGKFQVGFDSGIKMGEGSGHLFLGRLPGT